MITKRILLSILLFFGTFSFAYADVIVEQLNNDGAIDVGGSFQAQTLGSGLEGTVGSVTLRTADNSNNYAATNLRIIEYSDSGYTTQVAFCDQDFSGFLASPYNDRDLTFDFSEGCDAGTMSLELNPSSYYAIVNSNYNAGFNDWRGSSSNSYPNGEVCTPSSISTALADCLGDAPLGGFYDWYFIIDTGIPSNTDTRIITTLPSGGQVYATSTNFGIGGTVYVNENDFDDGMYYHVELAKNDQITAVGPVFAIDQIFGFRSWDWDIEDIGQSSFASSTSLTAVGVYRLTASIRSEGFLFVPDSTLVSTTTFFTIGTTTQMDRIIQEETRILTELGLASPDLDCSLDFTSLLDLNLYSDAFNCVANVLFRLVVPTSEQVSALVNGVRDSVLQKVPFGYATRIYDIFQASTTPAVLPSTATVIPSNLPGAGTPIDFDVFSEIPNALNTIESMSVPTMEGNPLTNFLYWWEVLWKIVFMFWVIKQFYGAFSGGDFDSLAPGARGRYEREVGRRRRSIAIGRDAMKQGPDYSDKSSKY